METTYGVYPEAHEVAEDGAARTLTIRNRFYSITHSLNHGGAISGVGYRHAGDRDLLLGPCTGEVTLAGGGTYSEGNDRQVEVGVQGDGSDVILAFEGLLRDAEGRDCGITYRHTYRHRWGHVKVEKRLHFPDGLHVSGVCLHSWSLRPELTHYGIRPGAPAEASSWTAAFGVCQWGAFAPGEAFDSAWESRFVPRYVGCASPGREGIEWFVGSDLAQWDYQLGGAPGYGGVHLAAQTRPPGVSLRVCPLSLPRGGVVLSGDYDFTYYVGVPVISGRANRLFVHKSFNRRHWPTHEQIRHWADDGVTSAHFHHDGDSFRDGQFWRDGSYPPFGPEDMAEYDRVITDCHRHGIRVATYFSNKELHPTVAAYQEHGAEWARLPDNSWEQLHNAYSGDEYGAQMCLHSGWADFHKEYIDTVLSHHPLDGTYYDWNVALYCHNTRHVPGHEGDELHPGVGAWAFSPAGHWDMDELLDLVAWTRRRVGPEGLMILHNTMVPMAATENYADSIVAMEWGYSRLATGAPDLDALPLEWSFMGHRSRGVIGYGCLEKGAPERVHRQMTMRAVLTGVVPWTADDLACEMLAGLSHRDLSRFRFVDARTTPLLVDCQEAAGALYHRPDEALLVVGNLAAEARLVRCRVDASRCDLTDARTYTVQAGDRELTLSPAQLRDEGVEVEVEGDGVKVLTVRPG